MNETTKRLIRLNASGDRLAAAIWDDLGRIMSEVPGVTTRHDVLSALLDIVDDIHDRPDSIRDAGSGCLNAIVALISLGADSIYSRYRDEIAAEIDEAVQ